MRDDAELFATARLVEDGNAVAWDGVDLEMSADRIEMLAEEAMTPTEFARFLERNRLTQEGAAALLGMNPNTLTSRLRALGLRKTFVS